MAVTRSRVRETGPSTPLQSSSKLNLDAIRNLSLDAVRNLGLDEIRNLSLDAIIMELVDWLPN